MLLCMSTTTLPPLIVLVSLHMLLMKLFSQENLRLASAMMLVSAFHHLQHHVGKVLHHVANLQRLKQVNGTAQRRMAALPAP